MNPTTEEIKEITKEYKTQISVPKTKPLKQFFVCPIGIIGAGKTTVLKPLSKKLSLVRVSGDEVRKLLQERGFGYDEAWGIGQAVVEEFAENGYSIAHDADCVSKRTQDNLKALASKTGAEIFWIHINPPERFILDKLGSLKPNWLGTAEEMVENYNQRKPFHENLDFDFTYVFDTSKDNLDKQIEEAKDIILSKVSSHSNQ